jgi:hypothetical protein
MNSTFKIAASILLVFFFESSSGQAHKLDSVKLESEGFNTESFTDVTCEAFDDSFKETKKIKVTHQKAQLSNLTLLVKGLKKVQGKSIDVRGKVTYYYGRSLNSYCFDVFGRFYKDGRFYYSKDLLIAISNILYSTHPNYLDTLRYHE